MHAEYTIRAAKAGKHVLCEKPVATTVADSEAMIAACRKANKKLMIAYRCQLEAFNLRAIQMIRDGKLGKILAIESANGFNIRPNEWRLNRKLAGGGPLMEWSRASRTRASTSPRRSPAKRPSTGSAPSLRGVYPGKQGAESARRGRAERHEADDGQVQFRHVAFGEVQAQRRVEVPCYISISE